MLPINQPQHQAAAPDDDRHAHQDAENDEAQMPVGGRRYGNHVVQAHHHIGHDHRAHRAPQRGAAVDRAVAVSLVRQHQLHADPQQQHGADGFQVRQFQQLQRKKDQHDPRRHGAHHTPQDALAAHGRRQPAAGQRDHHGVVAAKQDVDQDDLADRDPERRVCEIHGHAGSACEL
jgi:hypothetical protein